jgi:hypothetical protein
MAREGFAALCERYGSKVRSANEYRARYIIEALRGSLSG